MVYIWTSNFPARTTLLPLSDRSLRLLAQKIHHRRHLRRKWYLNLLSEQSRNWKYVLENQGRLQQRVLLYNTHISIYKCNSNINASDLFDHGSFGHQINQASALKAAPAVAKKRTRQEPGSDQSACFLQVVFMYTGWLWYIYIEIYIYMFYICNYLYM